MPLTAIILTQDEERHIARAIASVATVADRVFVVDSGSIDRTREIAASAGATILSHPWRNYATQFNWALEQLPADTEWVLRLDADEIVTPGLQTEILENLPVAQSEIQGIHVARRMNFLGGPVQWGGVFPIRVLRLFRHGAGHCENRWMDEHIMVEGPVMAFGGEILDDNLNSLSWWIDKHNHYASREVVDLLNLEYHFLPHDSVADLRGGQAGAKRWVKERLYARLPSGLRAGAYFLYRYVLRLGFLDGREGRAFHVLQGFWYRYLVDTKLREVKAHMRREQVDATQAIRAILGIDL
ncbi:glycosyltransferase family 2 protein [Ruegeria sp. HKCCD8929]|uniref:glycosyltransferase family 2 protein n=1 Tax=Ruegeria sp. HKCCD8929 TaxID=2683006 RepID=UPI0014888003